MSAIVRSSTKAGLRLYEQLFERIDLSQGLLIVGTNGLNSPVSLIPRELAEFFESIHAAMVDASNQRSNLVESITSVVVHRPWFRAVS